MKVLFWLGVIWIGYVYVGYPAVLALMALWRRIEPAIDEDFLPGVSVLMAARNEEKDIGWKVNETLQWDYPRDRLEVLVASDASEDGTDTILLGIKDPRLKFVRMETRTGKAVALNRLASLASGELLFFTDANAHLAPGCLRRVTRHFADTWVGCVTGDTHNLREQDSSIVESGTSVYGGYESWLKHLESELGSVLTCDGAVFCIRRSLYEPLVPDLANDLELPLKIGAAGYWVRHEPGAVVEEKETRSWVESFSQRRRISAQGALALWRLWTTLQGLRKWQFISRKFLRWLTLVPLGLILFSSAMLVDQPRWALLFYFQLVVYGLALAGLVIAVLGRDGPRLAAVAFFVVLGSVSTLVGVLDALRGRRFAVWNTPALSRGGEGGNWEGVN